MRLHSLERSPLFTEILDFLYPGKKPGRLSQPTHGVPPKGLFLFPAQSKGSACNDHHKWPWHAYTKTARAAFGVPWQHDPSTVNVAHPAHDVMRNTHYVFKETLPFSSQVRYFGKWHFSRGILRSQYLGLENVLGVTGVCWILSVAELRTGFFVVVVVVFFFFALSPFTFSRASGNLLVFCLNSHWLLVIASLSLIGRCDVFWVGFITR